MNYSLIRSMDISNGPGIRVSLFVSGCNFHCLNCFNKEAQDFNYGQLYTKEIEDMIISKIKLPYVCGLSILGGDPLYQKTEGLKQLIELCKQVKLLNKDIWIWTGYTWEQIFKENKLKQELIKTCDVLVDGLYQQDKKDYKLLYRGSSNQRVIDIQKSIKQNKIINVI